MLLRNLRVYVRPAGGNDWAWGRLYLLSESECEARVCRACALSLKLKPLGNHASKRPSEISSKNRPLLTSANRLLERKAVVLKYRLLKLLFAVTSLNTSQCGNLYTYVIQSKPLVLFGSDFECKLRVRQCELTRLAVDLS